MEPAVDAWHALLACYGQVSSQLEKSLQEQHRVSLAEFEALLWIHNFQKSDSAVRTDALSGRLLLTHSGVSRLLSRMESAGYVERLASPSDARRKDVRLTDAGQAALAAMRVDHRGNLTGAMSERLTDAELTTLTSLLTRLTSD